MKAIIDALSLRPIWTRWALEWVWRCYAAVTLLHLAWTSSFIFWPMTTVSGSAIFSLIVSGAFTLLNLVMVRIFLELALKFLSAPGKPDASANLPSL